MRPTCYVREASLLDAFRLAPRLRVADRNEVSASTDGKNELLVLLDCLEWSEWALAICSTDDDELIALCGVAGADRVTGIPWLLASDELVKHSITFLRCSYSIVMLMLAYYPILTNHVDARNTTHIRWLKWCGFYFDTAQDIYPNGYRFHQFSMGF